MTITTIDLFVMLAIVYFCYLGKQLLEMVKRELEPEPREEHLVVPPEWTDEIRWKDE